MCSSPLNVDKYIQCGVSVGSGIDLFKEKLATRVNIVRVFLMSVACQLQSVVPLLEAQTFKLNER